MNRILLLLTAVIITLATGCTQPDEISSPEPLLEIMQCDNDALMNVPYKGLTEKTIVFSANYDWTASASEEWINVSPQNGKAGEECMLTISVDENQSGDTRSGIVSVSMEDLSLNIEVQQLQKDEFALSLSQVQLPQAGGSFDVSVLSNVAYEYEIESDWIKSASTRASRNELLRFEVEPNPSTDERIGKVVFTADGGHGATLTVIQSQTNKISLSTTSIDVAPGGERIAIEVSSNIAYDVEIESGCDWVAQLVTRAMVSRTLEFHVAENTTGVLREAEITISGEGLSETVQITQSPLILMPDNKITYTSTNGSIVEPFDTDAFNVNIISNTYADGKGEIVFDGTLTTIGKEAFSKCVTLSSISIPPTVNTMGESAFYNCTALTRVDISDLKAWCNINFANETATPLYDGAKFYLNGKELRELEIPSGVTWIRDYAFYGCRRLKKVTIPDDVSLIRNYAFALCSSISEIVLGKDIYKICDYAFNNCSSLETITTASSAVGFGQYVFYAASIKTVNFIISNWQDLLNNSWNTQKFESPGERHIYKDGQEVTELVIPEGVTKIGEYALKDCISLTSITIPSTVASVGIRAFDNCTGELVLNCKELIESDGDSPFSDTGFSKVVICDGATRVGKRLLSSCDSLIEVIIPSSVTEIGKGAFDSCDALQSLRLPEGLKVIGADVCMSCPSLKEIVIPDSVTEIGEKAFSYCTSLSSVKLGKGIVELPQKAFERSALTEITIPDNVVKIGGGTWTSAMGSGELHPAGAFYDCANLKKVILGKGVKDIGRYAFGKTALQSIYISDLAQWCGISFGDRLSQDNTVELYLNGNRIKDLVIPEGVERINCYAFSGYDLSSVTCPESLEEIDVYAFSQNKNLTKVCLPAGLKSLGDGVFANCESLTEIVLPEGLEKLGTGIRGSNVIVNGGFSMVGSSGYLRSDGGVFNGCSGLTTISIPENVTAIAGIVFGSCPNLKSIYCYPSTPPEIKNASLPTDVEIFVTEDAYVAYEKAWPDHITQFRIIGGALLNTITYTTTDGQILTPSAAVSTGATILSNVYQDGQGVITLDRNITTIGASAFKNCTTLESITIPSSIVTIKENAFYGCTSLKNINIPDKVTEIGGSAFYNCSSMESVTIPESVTAYGYAFQGCGGVLTVNCNIPKNAFYGSAFTNVYIGDSVTEIGESSFANCKSLTNVAMGENVESIGASAFLNCESLVEIVIPDKVQSIKKSTFEGCTSLTEIVIPDSVVSIGDDAFREASSLVRVSMGTGVVSVSGGAFLDCKSLEKVDISDLSAWYGIDFEYRETNPLYYAHKLYLNGTEVTELNIPSGVEAIKKYQFYGCTSLVNVTIPESVTSIQTAAFMDCTSLTSVIIPNSVTEIGGSAFKYCRLLNNVTIPDGITEIKYATFSGCHSLVSVVVPDGVTSIGEDAFRDCTKMQSISIPSSVTNIGDDAFYDCRAFQRVDISDLSVWCQIDFVYSSNPIHYGAKIYMNGSEVKNLVIPSDVTEIKRYAFYNCGNIERVEIPSTVTAIGQSAFDNCGKVSEIICKASTPPSGSKYMFPRNNKYKVYVPSASLEAYKTAEFWSDYASQIVAYE